MAGLRAAEIYKLATGPDSNVRSRADGNADNESDIAKAATV